MICSKVSKGEGEVGAKLYQWMDYVANVDVL